MSPPAVDCRELTCRFGTHVAVDGIDLSVRAGEVFGLLGPNGAGKTTTIRSIITLLPVEPGINGLIRLMIRSHPGIRATGRGRWSRHRYGRPPRKVGSMSTRPGVTALKVS